MTPSQVIKHFGSQNSAAEALGIGQPAISNWVARGVVPKISQLRLEIVTNGALKADKSILSTKKKVSRK